MPRPRRESSPEEERRVAVGEAYEGRTLVGGTLDEPDDPCIGALR